MQTRFVIPSRKRPFDCLFAENLIPEATIVVHESEFKEYKEVLSTDKNLYTHKLDNIARIRQWILDEFKEECIVFVDDDLKFAQCHVGEKVRKITDENAIKQIIMNAAQIAKDLDISLFGFTRRPAPMHFKPFDPFEFCKSLVAGTWGIIGRKYRFDSNLTTREDIDISMQSLLEDRIMFIDTRFYFQHGNLVTRGEGGNQGVRTHKSEIKDMNIIANKWGKLVDLQKKKKKTTGCTIHVNRRQYNG